MLFLTGVEDFDQAAKILQQQYHIPLICITMGKEGSKAYYKNWVVEAPPFIQENTIETTGAGDTFTGCLLYSILEKGLENLSKEELFEILLFANAGASLITTKRGALKVMPRLDEIEQLLQENDKFI